MQEKFELEKHSPRNANCDSKMADSLAILANFKTKSFRYLNFTSKSKKKPIKEVRRHLPNENQSGRRFRYPKRFSLLCSQCELDTTTRPSLDGGKHQVNQSVYLVNRNRNTEGNSWNRPMRQVVARNDKVEVSRSQNGLTQCYNGQNFDVWSNSRQRFRCFWCEGEHPNKKLPEAAKKVTFPSTATETQKRVMYPVCILQTGYITLSFTPDQQLGNHNTKYH